MIHVQPAESMTKQMLEEAYLNGKRDAVLLQFRERFEGVTAEMDARIAHFFKTGVQLVWVVHPQSKQVCVYRSTKDCKILEIGDVLDGGKVLPGYSLPLAELFNLPSLLS